MKRRYCFLLTLVFLSGLIWLDWELARRPGKLQELLRNAIEKLVKVPINYDPIDISVPTEIVVKNIRIRPDENTEAPFLTCSSLVARIDFWKLLRGELEIDRIELNGPELHLYWGEDGELSVPSIFESGESHGGRLAGPEVFVSQMVVRFHDAPFWGAREVAISGIELDMQPSLFSKTYPYSLKGMIDDKVFGRFDLKADFGGALLDGTIKQTGFRLGTEHGTYLQSSIRETLDRIKMSDGSVDLTVHFFSLDVLDRIDYVIDADIKDVQIAYDDWPFAISKMKGRLSMTGLNLEAKGPIKFELADAPVEVSELLVDFSGAEPGFKILADVRDLNIDQNIANDLITLPEPFPDVGDSLLALGARGKINVEARLEQVPGHDRVDVDILAAFNGANLAYQGFIEEDGTRVGYPYPLEQVVGSVRIGNDGLVFQDLRSTVRSPDLVANGWVNYGQKPFGYSVDIVGRNILLDDKVRITLPASEREIYDSYGPSGQVDFSLKIDLPPGREDSPDVRLDVDLKGCGAEPRLFPYPLEDLRGHLVFGQAKGTVIQDVTAANGKARFTVNGLLDHSSAVDDPTYTLDIAVEDLAIDEPLLTGLGAEFPEIASEIRRFNFDGYVDFDCHITSEGEGALNTYAARLKGLDFRYEEVPTARCSKLVGKVSAQGERLLIEQASFELAKCAVTASGWVEIGESVGHDLLLECSDLRVNDETLRMAADAVPFMNDVDELMDLEGVVSLSVKMRKGPRGEIVRSKVTAQGLRVTLREPALLFEDVYGSLEAEGDDLNFDGWTAALPYGDDPNDSDRLILNVNQGRWRRSPDGDQVHVHEIGFRDLMLDERLFRRLPESWAKTLRDWELRGRVAGRIASLIFSRDQVSFHGALQPSELTLDPGLAIGINHGTVLIEDATFGPDGFDVKGSLDDADLTVAQFPILHAQAVFQVDHRSLALRDLSGDCFGGRVNPQETFFVMDHGIDDHFETSASLSEIELSQWVGANGGDPKTVSGRATAWGRLEGLASNKETFTGEGELWLSGRRLYDLPLLATILQFLNLDFLANDEVQTAHCEAAVRDSKILINNARFDGPGVRLRGGGEIGFDGIARLEFSPKIIKLLDPIPLIGDLVHVVTGFVVSKIKISGPLEDLRAEGENYITEMLPGEEDSGRRLKPRAVEPEKK